MRRTALQAALRAVLLAVLALAAAGGTALAQSGSRLATPVVSAQLDGTTVLLSWQPVEGADTYAVYVWDTQVGAWDNLGGDHHEETSFRHESAQPGGTYFYAVRAESDTGNNSYWSSNLRVDVPRSAVASTATPAPQPTATATPASKFTATPAPTATLAPTFTATPAPTATLAPTFTPTPVPTATLAPTFTPTPAPTATATATATAIAIAETANKCVLVSYDRGLTGGSSLTVPLIREATKRAYEAKFRAELGVFYIVAVEWHADGRVEIWYRTGGSPVRIVSELFRGCQFLGHTEWQELFIVN